MCLCVHRMKNSLCVSVFVGLCVNCLRGKGEILVPLCVQKDKVPPSMCHYVTLKIWSLQRNVTFDSTQWGLIVTLTRICVHTHSVRDPLCVCVFTTHLFHIGALLLHQRMLVESPFARSRAIWKGFCVAEVCLRAWELENPRVGESSEEVLDT